MRAAIYSSNGYLIVHNRKGYRVFAPGIVFLGRALSLGEAVRTAVLHGYA